MLQIRDETKGFEIQIKLCLEVWLQVYDNKSIMTWMHNIRMQTKLYTN